MTEAGRPRSDQLRKGRHLLEEMSPRTLPGRKGAGGARDGSYQVIPKQTSDEVYPRGCGGTGGPTTSVSLLGGLSPRMRGHPENTLMGLAAHGSIPADAGAPAAQKVRRDQIEVYPRGCGGTSTVQNLDSITDGLSPRMRGHLRLPVKPLNGPRSIPADAGAPTVPPNVPNDPKVYPRGCGGTCGCRACAFPCRGLSPRMRGHRQPTKLTISGPGSIPADAGAPSTESGTQFALRVYPRGCGGTPATVCQELGATGPSLRVSRQKRDSLSQGKSRSINVRIAQANYNTSHSAGLPLRTKGPNPNRSYPPLVAPCPLQIVPQRKPSS